MKRGIQLAFMTACISGISIFANAIFVSKTDPLVFAFVRNVIVAGIFSLLFFSRSKIGEIRSLSKKDWGMLLLIGAIGGGIPFALFFTGLGQIGAVNGNLIQKTLFMWVLLLAVPILKEKVRLPQIVGYATLFLGMFFFGGAITVVPKTGTLLVLIATILWAIEQIIAKITLKRVSPYIVAWGRIVFGLPFLLGAIFLFGKSHLLFQSNSYVVIPLISSAVLLTAYMSAWYSALSKAPATLVSSVLVLAPVVTALLSWWVLHKPIIGSQTISFGLLILGVASILVTGMRLRPHTQYES